MDVLTEMADELRGLMDVLNISQIPHLSDDFARLAEALGINQVEQTVVMNPKPATVKEVFTRATVWKSTFVTDYFEPKLLAARIDPDDYDVDDFLQDHFMSDKYDIDWCAIDGEEYIELIRRWV